MAIVTGYLRDFTGAPASLGALSPQIIFTPSGPAIGTTYVLASRPIPVEASIVNGQWSAELVDTGTLRPASWYTVSLRWREPDMFGPGNGFVGMDFPDWKLFVPPEGGAFTELINAPWNPVLGWFGPNEPSGVPVINTLWLNNETGELFIRRTA